MSLRTNKAHGPPRPLESRLLPLLRVGVARRTASVGTLADEGENALRYGIMTEPLRDDKEVVLAVVRRNPDALRFASNRLRGDPEIARVYIRRLGGHVFLVLSERLRSRADMAIEALHAVMGYAPLLAQRDKKNFSEEFEPLWAEGSAPDDKLDPDPKHMRIQETQRAVETLGAVLGLESFIT